MLELSNLESINFAESEYRKYFNRLSNENRLYTMNYLIEYMLVHDMLICNQSIILMAIKEFLTEIKSNDNSTYLTIMNKVNFNNTEVFSLKYNRLKSTWNIFLIINKIQYDNPLFSIDYVIKSVFLRIFHIFSLDVVSKALIHILNYNYSQSKEIFL